MVADDCVVGTSGDLRNVQVVTWGEAESGGTSAAVQHQLREIQQIHVAVHAFAACRLDGSVVTWGDPRCGGNMAASARKLQAPATSTYLPTYLATYLPADLPTRLYCTCLPTCLPAYLPTYRPTDYRPTDLPTCQGDSSQAQSMLKDVQDICAGAYAFAALCADGTATRHGHAHRPPNRLLITGPSTTSWWVRHIQQNAQQSHKCLSI